MKEETKCYCGHTTYCDCGPEQETLEEAAKKYFKKVSPNICFYDAVEFGAKWQQERIYNQVNLEFNNENITGFSKLAFAKCLDIIQQFKKKEL
jgi:hypothetical protein